MKIKLNEFWINKLLSFPETGMGYQRVEVVLKSGQIIPEAVVLNAEDLVLPDQYADLKLEEITELIVLNRK